MQSFLFSTVLIAVSMLSCGTSMRLKRSRRNQLRVANESALGLSDCPLSSHAWPLRKPEQLSEYSPEKVGASLEDPRLLILLQRDLLRVERLIQVSPADDFNAKFPEEYAAKKLRSNVTWAAGWGAVNLASFGLPTFSVIGKATTAVTTGAGATDFLVWAKDQYRQDRVRNEVDKLTNDWPLEYWDDVTLGLLFDLYEKVLPTWIYWNAEDKVISKKTNIEYTKMNQENDAPLVKGKRELMLGTGVDSILETQAKRQKLKLRNGAEGWIDRPSSILSQGWYVRGKNADDDAGQYQRIPVHKVLGDFDAEHKDEIYPGEMIRVVDSLEYGPKTWLELADDRGWAFQENDQGQLHGPMNREAAAKMAEEKLQSDMDETIGLLAPKLNTSMKTSINSVNKYWTSTASQFAKLLVAGGLVAAGPVTHGLTWALASGISVGFAGVDIALAVSMTSTIVQYLTHALGALASFEKRVFSGSSVYRHRCSAERECPKKLCENEDADHPLNGFVCMRHGLFVRINYEGMDGFCVPRPRALMSSGEVCATDIDCNSGKCNMVHTGSAKDKLIGKCV